MLIKRKLVLEKGEEAMRKKISWLGLFLLCLILIGQEPARAAAVNKPVILTKVITDATTEIRVLGAAGTTLSVKNGTKSIKTQKFTSAGIQTISIKAQKSGSTLKFQLKKGKAKSQVVNVKVKKLTSQKRSSSVKKPVVSTKTVKSSTTVLKVRAEKGTTLKIVNDSQKTVKSVKYTATGTKTIKIPKQRDTETLYFYCVKGNKRSAVVKKRVQDVSAPAKPKVKEKKQNVLLVQGELGSKVYVKSGKSKSYVKKGVIMSKTGLTISKITPDSKGNYYIKLKDEDGNTSPVQKLKSKYHKNDSSNQPGKDEPADQPGKDEPVYSYEIIPLLPPFNHYFYVKTEDPDPSDIRFMDKESVLYTKGEEPSYIAPVESRFLDVVYENKKTGRVKDGYIFVVKGGHLDGGNLVLQKEITYIENYYWQTEYRDTKQKAVCPSVTSSAQYLIDHYTTAGKGLFENLNAVESALDEIAQYPRGIKDSSKKNPELPYPLLTVSPYPELSLNEWYEMYEDSEERLFVSDLYPFVLHSLTFPGMIGTVAKMLDPTCKVKTGAYHYLVDVTKDGETHSYGGAGKGGSDPFYSHHIEKLFRFDGSAGDYVGNVTLESLGKKRQEYGALAIEDAKVYRELIAGKAFKNAVGMGSWIRVGTEGLSLSNKSYAYVTLSSQKQYWSGEERIPAAVEEMWVDGRYINVYNQFAKGAKFEDYPKADIMIRNMTYTNWKGENCREDAIFTYDEEHNLWKNNGYNYGNWETIPIEEFPEDMILTPEEVQAMDVDRNTDTIPSGLIYDGSAVPGTPY